MKKITALTLACCIFGGVFSQEPTFKDSLLVSPQSVVIKKDVDFPYSLDWKKELIISSVAITTIAVPLITGPRLKPTPDEIKMYSPDDVNIIDRFAIYQNDPKASLASDWLQNSLVGLGAISTVLIGKFKLKPSLTLLAMYSEAFALNFGITYAFKNFVSRPRPYVYDPQWIINNNGVYGDSDFQSHISGHTSTAFMSAFFMGKTFHDVFPKSPWRYVVWTTGISMATATAALRIAGGKHYVTDVVHGALWGALTGYFIPVLHKKPMFLGKKKRTELKLSPLGGNGFYGFSARLKL